MRNRIFAIDPRPPRGARRRGGGARRRSRRDRGADPERPRGRADRAGLGVEAERRGARPVDPVHARAEEARRDRPGAARADVPPRRGRPVHDPLPVPRQREGQGVPAPGGRAVLLHPHHARVRLPQPQGQHRFHRRADGPLRPAEHPRAVLGDLRGHGHRVQVGVRRGAAGREGARRLVRRAEVVRTEDRRPAGEGGELLRLGDAPRHVLLHRIPRAREGEVRLHQAAGAGQPPEGAADLHHQRERLDRAPSPTTPSPRRSSRRNRDDAALRLARRGAVPGARRRGRAFRPGGDGRRERPLRGGRGPVRRRRLRPGRRGRRGRGRGGAPGDAVRRATSR